MRALQALQRTKDVSSDHAVGGKVLSQFALEKRPPTGRPPLSPGKSQSTRKYPDTATATRRRGRTLSSSGSGQDVATTLVKQGTTAKLPLSPEEASGEISFLHFDEGGGSTPDISISTSAATEEEDTSVATGAMDLSRTEEEEGGESMSTSSSPYIDEGESTRSDDRSRTSSAHTAEMSLGVD